MKDPYRILGISSSASDEEVKEAYRQKLNEYQEHRFSDTPEAAQAEESIRILNEAYDAIMMRRQEDSPPAEDVGYQQATPPPMGGGTSADSQYLDVRRLIQTNRITEAEEVLNGVPFERRDGEWYFLKGTIYYNRGRLEDAYEHYDRAVQMDPGNTEYQATLNQLRLQRQTGRPPQGGMGGYRTGPAATGCSICDVCTFMYCSQCCCQCMGMDCC